MTGSLRTRVVLVIATALAAIALAGCGESSAPDSGSGVAVGSVSATFPITGRTPSGARYRVSPGKPSPSDDVASSWCLRLAYSGEIVIVDAAGGRNELANGLGTCGPAPAPIVSGAVSIDCSAGELFVFGQARPASGGVVLETSGGERIAARRGPPSPGSGFDGFSYVLTARVDQLPASVRSAADGKQAVRLPASETLCRPVPGVGLSGVEPFLSFP